MDAETSAAIITGVTGLVGVAVGSFIPVIQGLVSNKSKVKKDTAYLAIMVVSHLDRFANGCVAVALDDGTEYGQPAGQDGIEHVATTSPPEFKPLDIDVDWKVLPLDLMYAILELPGKHDRVQNRLAGIAEFESDYPRHTDYFWARRYDYAELALHATSVARKLRKHAGMQVEEPRPREWNLDEEMRDVMKKIDDARELYQKQVTEGLATAEKELASKAT